MDFRTEITKWIDPIVELIQKNSNEYPEFDKLYPLFNETSLFYELFHPLGVSDEGIYGFYKTFRTLAHAWYDDGEISIIHAEFEYTFWQGRKLKGEDVFVLEVDPCEKDEYLKSRIKNALLTHRKGWDIEVKAYRIAPFRKGWVNFLVDTLMPLYKGLSGVSTREYLEKRKIFDQTLFNKVVEESIAFRTYP